jgi:hypothetical protein
MGSKITDLPCPLFEHGTVEGVEKCIIATRDIIMFCAWIVLSVLAAIVDVIVRSATKQSGSAATP